MTAVVLATFHLAKGRLPALPPEVDPAVVALFAPLCLLVVAGIVALLVYNSNQKANYRFRNRCGECSHVSAWHTESEAERQCVAHYAERHPGIRPGGVIETRGR